MYKIKKAPDSLMPSANYQSFPFLEMKVGEMFEVENSAKTRNAVNNSIQYMRRNNLLNGHCFSLKSIDEQKLAVIRVPNKQK